MASIRVFTMKIRGGQAKPEPPITDAANIIGLNAKELADQVNSKTSRYKGFNVAVKIIVNEDTREYEIEVKPPTTTELLLQAVGVEEPSGNPAQQKIGDLSFEKIVEIAILKKPSLNTRTLKAAVKTIIGSARSIGITIDGKDGKQVTREIDEGLYDNILAKYEEEWMNA